MICAKCDHDLAKCSCPDLEERFSAILKCEFVHLGDEYQARIRANIERAKTDRGTQAITE